MRVLGGSRAGAKLKAPPGSDVRPLLARAKTSLFSRLAQEVEGAFVLDLFAGSGALGIEALSRGAAKVVFCERDPRTLRVLEGNLRSLRFPAVAWQIVAGDLLGPESLSQVDGPVHLALLAPPFALLRSSEGRSGFEALLDRVLTRLEPGGLAAVQVPTRFPPTRAPAGGDEEWRKAFGKSLLVAWRNGQLTPAPAPLESPGPATPD